MSNILKKGKKAMMKGLQYIDPATAAIDNFVTGKKPRTGRNFIDPSGTYASTLNPKVPEVPNIPGTPLIDDAANERSQSDRSRRRRGVLATVFGGAKKNTLG